ncbi:hypothetical protein GCM10025777_38560 [Membranihabitans marinus]
MSKVRAAAAGLGLIMTAVLASSTATDTTLASWSSEASVATAVSSGAHKLEAATDAAGAERVDAGTETHAGTRESPMPMHSNSVWRVPVEPRSGGNSNANVRCNTFRVRAAAEANLPHVFTADLVSLDYEGLNPDEWSWFHIRGTQADGQPASRGCNSNAAGFLEDITTDGPQRTPRDDSRVVAWGTSLDDHRAGPWEGSLGASAEGRPGSWHIVSLLLVANEDLTPNMRGHIWLSTGSRTVSSTPGTPGVGWTDSVTAAAELETTCAANDESTTAGGAFLFNEETGVLRGFNGTPPSTVIVIPSTINCVPVTSIPGRAFAESNLTNVIIPDSVMAIGSQAFTGNPLRTASVSSHTRFDANAFPSDTNVTVRD